MRRICKGKYPQVSSVLGFIKVFSWFVCGGVGVIDTWLVVNCGFGSICSVFFAN